MYASSLDAALVFNELLVEEKHAILFVLFL